MDRPKFGSQTSTNMFSEGKPKEKKREEIGAIWTKRTKYNEDLLTIRLNKKLLEKLLESQKEDTVKLVAYSNNKTSEKQPNFRIFEDTVQEKK